MSAADDDMRDRALRGRATPEFTPGTWRINKYCGGESVLAPAGFMVADCCITHPRMVIPCAGNARRIVQCVNAHDELVAALEALIEMQDQLRKGGVLPADYGIVRGRAHAALAKARGGSE